MKKFGRKKDPIGERLREHTREIGKFGTLVKYYVN